VLFRKYATTNVSLVFLCWNLEDVFLTTLSINVDCWNTEHDREPSFEGGGAYWFTDLMTLNDLYILPVLTSMAYAAEVRICSD
jgi:hypothetical protein